MKKKTIFTTAAVALVTTTIGAGAANADNVQTTTSNNVQAKASDKVTNADLNSAKQNVSSAKASVSSAQTNVNSAQNKVNADKQDVANKQSAVSSAQSSVDSAQKNADIAKQKVADASSKIPEIQNSIKSQESTINNDQTTIAHTKQNISNQQKSVVTAKQNVSSAQANVNSEQVAVSSAQSNVDKDQQRIDDIHNAQAIASSAQNKVNADKQDVANKQSAKDNAQVAVDQASSVKAQADQKVNDANENLTNAQNKENQDQAKLDDTQKKLDDVTDKINSINSITLPNGYTEQALNDLPNAGLGSKLFSEGMNDPANVYHPSKADDYQVDPAHLTNDQQKDLSIWAASIINPIRQQLGYKPMIVNQSAMDFANAIGQEYVKDNWDQQQQGHDVPAIERAAAKFGLNSTDGNLYEDADAVSNSVETMNALKAQVYFDLKQFLFYDVLHAESVIGYNFGNTTAPSYFAISTDGVGTLHFVQVHGDGGWMYPSNIQDPSKFNVNDNYAVPSTNINELRQQQSSLQLQVNNEKNVVNADKQVVSNAQHVLDVAKNAQSQANNDLTNKQTVLTNASNALQQSQSQLSEDEVALVQAEKDVANAPAELKVANDQLAKDNQGLVNAKNALSDAQSKLANAKNAQSQAESKLNDLNNQLKQDEQHLANDQSTLAQLQKQLSDLQDAPAKLQAAQDKLSDAQSKLAQVKNALTSSQATLNADQKVLSDVQDKLNDAKIVETQAEKHLADLQNAYDAQHKVTESQAQQNVKNDQQAVVDAQSTLDNLVKSGASQVEITKAQTTLDQAKEQLTHDQKVLTQVRQANHVSTTVAIGSTYTLGTHTVSEPTVLSTMVKTSNDNTVHADTVTTVKNAKITDKTASTADMPQAGETSSSVASILGAGLLAVLSFFGLVYKKEEK